MRIMTKNKRIFGLGINNLSENVYLYGKASKPYQTWKGMLERCYSSKCHSKRPTYIGCTVAPEWLYFSNFKKWYDENYKEGFELDKDILVEGNKVYSPDTCRFVPQNINKLLNDNSNARKSMQIGIVLRKPSKITRQKSITYQAQCSNGFGKQLTKTFKTVEEASAWYSETKARVVREVATRALEAGEIQQDIFDALLARKF